MTETPSRTVEVILDTESEALLMARGPAFHLEGIKERFSTHVLPPVAAELAANPSVNWLKFAARVMSGALRLLRR